jgi:hypothetical protein
LKDAYKKAKKDYQKLKNGSELFKKLDPEVAYRKCPRLKEFLDEVLRVAHAAMA